MSRILLLLFLLEPALFSFSQGWSGYQTGLFSGISSANARPGGMASSPYKVDATVVGIHLYTQTENLFKNKDAIDVITTGGLKGLTGFSKIKTGSTNVFSNIQGPSALWSINPKITVAFSWNIRFLWSSKASSPDIYKLFDQQSGNVSFNMNAGNMTTNLNSWNEFGLGAGGIAWQTPHHTISVGGFLKLVFGASNWELDLQNLDVKTQDNVIEHIGFNLNMLLSKQAYNFVDQGKLKLFEKGGIGFDLGAEYRYNKDTSNIAHYNYRFKVGFALNDMGFMRYDPAIGYSQLHVSADNISLDRFRGLPSLQATVDTLAAIFHVNNSETSNYGVTLPMSLRIYGDYNFDKHLSLFSEFHFMFIRLINKYSNFPVLFEYTLTPRFEDKNYGVYLPVTFTNFQPANVGVALRWKPFIIGSSNLFTYYAYSGKFLDLYLKVKIPVLYKTERIRYQKKMNKIKTAAG